MLLLMARLGLRAVEVMAIQLDDIDSHMWTVHMSGLLLRSHMNAGQDGFRDTGPKHQDGLFRPMGISVYPMFRIDRSHHLLLSCKL
jgi:hypothetical protein